MTLEWVVAGERDELPDAARVGDALGDLGKVTFSKTDARALFMVIEGRGETARLSFVRTQEIAADITEAGALALSAAKLFAQISVPVSPQSASRSIKWAAHIVDMLGDHMEGPVLDPRTSRVRTIAEMRRDFLERSATARDLVAVTVEEVNQKSRACTRGMPNVGQPELVIACEPRNAEAAMTLMMKIAERAFDGERLAANIAFREEDRAFGLIDAGPASAAGAAIGGSAGLAIVALTKEGEAPVTIDDALAGLGREDAV